MSSSRIGAIFYLLWGVLHVNAAVQVYRLGHTLEPGMVQGRIYQDAWNLLFLAVAVALVAIVWNWKGDPFGYWLNLALASVTDVGFILTILVPGYLPLVPGVAGPVMWVLAILFTTLGRTRTP